MADRPIIFSDPMIRALLDGRKTQTRRVLKDQPSPREPVGGASPYGCDWVWQHGMDGSILRRVFPAPRYAPGDRLWVRESCALWTGAHRDTVYRADESAEDWANLKHDAGFGLWNLRSPTHMPRRASRITLIVKDVRVQRLQEIDGLDAIAEGIERMEGEAPWRTFRRLWNSIHGPDAWDANPWVAAITFDVKHGNIDTPTGGTNDRS